MEAYKNSIKSLIMNAKSNKLLKNSNSGASLLE